MIDQAAHQIGAENTELACAFIQKTAVEKAIPEMDKRLTEVGLTSYPDHMRWPGYEAKVGEIYKLENVPHTPYHVG